MTMQSEEAVFRREITIAAEPETVWRYLVESERASLWMGQMVDLDPRPGGLYRVEVVPGFVARGTFVELDPPRRLVYTWGWEPGPDGTPNVVPPGSSTVEVELEPADGSTVVRILHRDLPTAESVASHTRGWDHYLPRLVIAASGGDPGRDSWLSSP